MPICTDLLSLPDPLVADPLDAQRGGARSVQGHRGLHAEPDSCNNIEFYSVPQGSTCLHLVIRRKDIANEL